MWASSPSSQIILKQISDLVSFHLQVFYNSYLKDKYSLEKNNYNIISNPLNG